MQRGQYVFILGFLIWLLVFFPTCAIAADDMELEPPPISLLAAGDSFLTEEAGISAYGQASGVNLELARTAFKTIEKETADYIVGSVAIDGYGEDHDVHVYIDLSGWLVAYYLNHEKPGKIVDWVNYDGINISSTKLKLALDNVLAAQFLLPFSVEEVRYYHFGWPAATRMLVVTDERTATGTEYFYITVPTTGLYIYQRTWAHAVQSTSGTTHPTEYYVDGELLSELPITDPTWMFAEGDLTQLQLSAGLRIPFSLSNAYGGATNCYAAVVILYSEL
jgi:hypothetical protein